MTRFLTVRRNKSDNKAIGYTWLCPKCGTQNETSDGEAICQKCGYCQQFDAKTRFFMDIFQKISEMPKEENNT